MELHHCDYILSDNSENMRGHRLGYIYLIKLLMIPARI